MKVIVAPPTAVLGDVNISGVEAAASHNLSQQNLGGFKLLMSENLSNVGCHFFFKTTNFIKSFISF